MAPDTQVTQNKMSHEKQTQQRRRAILALFFTAIIWGSGFIATRIAHDATYSTPYIMLTRFGLGALVFALVKWRDLRDLSTKEWRGGFFAGLFLFLGFALQTFGLEDTTPARNAFFTATSILLVPFFTWLIFKERPPLRIFLAALVCFPGVLILSLDGATLRLSLSRGDILTLLGAVAFALHTVVVGFFAKQTKTSHLTFLQLCVAAILSLGLYWWKGPGLAQEPAVFQVPFLAVLFLAIFSTCIAYFLQTSAQRYVSPGTASVIVASESVFAGLFSVLLGYETMSASLLLGSSLIFLSVLMTEGRGGRKNKGR